MSFAAHRETSCGTAVIDSPSKLVGKFEGRPVVLAVANAWGSPRQQILDGIRCQLRGLGAVMIVVSGDHSYVLNADDAPCTLELDSRDAWTRNLLRLAGDRSDADSAKQLDLSVFDDRGRLRFGISRQVNGQVPEILLEALSAAVSQTLAANLAEQPELASAGCVTPSRQQAPSHDVGRLSRREVIVLSLASALATLSSACAPKPAHSPDQVHGAARLPVQLDVNGRVYPLELEPRVTLLDALREQMGLTGTKKGCDHGQCGACTVLVDGRRINACLTLAVTLGKKRVTTIEGLAAGDQLHPLQAAFVHYDALQCGYCTPGQIMSAEGLLKERRLGNRAEIRQFMSGNICRCGAYANIVEAIESVGKLGATG
jgi:xanthine dehydrogenase YagT iron-sulfur-binding subunit